jgi:succinate dehydrogenase/fumarate reductase flavoprotein subunit
MSSKAQNNTILTDLLVIGGGLGGLYAAIKAKQAGVDNVLIVDKGKVAVTGKSRLMAGSTIFLHPEDDPDQWLKAIFQGQQGLCNQDMVRSLLEESTERLRELEGWGIKYRRLPETGEYMRMPSRGLVPVQMTRRPHYKRMIGGKALTTVLRKVAKGLNIEFQDRTYISDLIVRDNRVLGAVGCERRTGEFVTLKAKAVVLATADCSFRGNYAGVKNVTGDTYGMAYRAGADLNNMEFMCCNTAPTDFNFEGTGPAGKLGAKFLNAKGEDFMPNYHPEGTGAEINYLVQAMTEEVRKGNGPPFFLDFRPTPEHTEGLYMTMGGWMPRNLERLKEEGIDFFDSKISWAPALQSQRGGVKTGMDCMSTVDGLFAAGIAHSTGPGLFNGWSSAKCIWSGVTSGRMAAAYIDESDDVKMSADLIGPLRTQLFNRQVGEENGGRTVSEITGDLQDIIFDAETSILKSGDRLTKAKERLATLATEELPQAAIPNYHEFIKFKETESLFFSADLFLSASLAREESRFDHKRDDFAERDDENWLKWIVFNRDLPNGHRLEELPWDRYPYQPADLQQVLDKEV